MGEKREGKGKKGGGRGRKRCAKRERGGRREGRKGGGRGEERGHHTIKTAGVVMLPRR